MVSGGQGTARRAEDGYTLAMLLIVMALMSVALGVAMPVWRQDAQREREEELLFRARQYARAVMLFQRKTPGAFPPSVDVLLERRFLRKKYRDPMVPGGEFQIVRAGQIVPGAVPPGAPTPGAPPLTPQPGASAPGAGGTPQGEVPPPTPGVPQAGSGQAREPGIDDELITGGIAGVVSRSQAKSIKEYRGRTHYNQWLVTVQDVMPRGTAPQPQPGTPGRPGATPAPTPGPGPSPGPPPR